MPGPLTWRNVDGPRLAGGLAGIHQFAQLLNGAFDTAGEAVGMVDKAKSDLVNKELQARLLQFQNPNDLSTALASGELLAGQDMRRVSGDMLNAFSNRVGGLTKQQDDLGDLNQETLDRNRENQNFEAFKAASPYMKKYLNMIETDPQKASQYRSSEEFQKGTAGLDVNQFLAGIKGIRLAEQDQISNASSRRNYNQDGTIFDRETLEYNEQQQVPTVTRQLLEFGTTAEDIDRGIRENPDKFQGISDRVLMAARRAAQGDSSITPYGPSAGGSGGGGGINAGAAAMMSPDNSAAIQAGAKELGINPEDLAAIISYETGGTFDPSKRGGKNNKHIGLIQFGEEEQRTFGANQNQSFPEQMGAVVRYLKARGARPGDDITQLYSIINAGGRDKFNLSDNGGKDTVASHAKRIAQEHRTNALAFLTGQADAFNANADTQAKSNQATDPLAPLAIKFAEKWNDTTDIRTVAANLVKGPMAGENINTVVDKLEAIQKKSRRGGQELNAALAGEILTESARGNRGHWDIRNPLFGGDGLEMAVDDAKVAELTRFAMDRDGLNTKIQGISQTAQTSAVAATARAEYQRLANVIADKKSKAAGRGITPNIGPEVIALEAAAQKYFEATGQRIQTIMAVTPLEEQPRALGASAGQSAGVATSKSKPAARRTTVTEELFAASRRGPSRPMMLRPGVKWDPNAFKR